MIVRRMTDDDMRVELARLLDQVGMTSQQLRDRGAAFKLDAIERNVLADVEALEWMLGE